MASVLASCVTPSIYAPKSKCSSLVPQSWSKPIADAKAPEQGSSMLDTLKSWIGFGASQTEKKQAEFERKQVSVNLIKRCEERDAVAVEKAQKKFLGIF